MLAVSGGHTVAQFLPNVNLEDVENCILHFQQDSRGGLPIFSFFFHLHMIITLRPHSYCKLNDTEI